MGETFAQQWDKIVKKKANCVQIRYRIPGKLARDKLKEQAGFFYTNIIKR